MSDDRRTIYVASENAGGPSGCYHTDRDCPKLKEGNATYEYDRERVADRRELCSVCRDGTDAYSAESCDWSFQNALREADPAEVGSDD